MKFRAYTILLLVILAFLQILLLARVNAIGREFHQFHDNIKLTLRPAK